MKKMMSLIAFVFAVVLCGLAQAKEQAKEHAKEDAKILIAYFSWSGNTRAMALQIQKQIGGDLFEITTAKPYPKNYDECVAFAKKEQENKARPSLGVELKDKVNDISAYDVVFIGYPNWWGTIPMVLFTFLEKYDLKGKTVVPFCTHGGGRWGRSLDDLKKLCPNSNIREGLTISGDFVRQSRNDVTKWLQKLKIK